jgi:NSS family neurotransmitter:Na+ symporter
VGVRYYLLPDFSKFSATTVLAAMGQLFYSMSLAMGIMITYGSYMKKDVNLESSVSNIEIFDTGIAFLAGLMIIPALFAVQGPEADVGKGPTLMFVVLPAVFAKMGIIGQFVGAAFFILVLFAALTSSISLMETVVSIICDRCKVNRKISCLIVFIGVILLGLPSTLGNGVWAHIKIMGFQFLDFFDFISNSVIMPIVALITSIFVGYILKPQAVIDEVKLSSSFKREKLFVLIIKYIAPIFLVVILVSSVLEVTGVLKI